jgi:hypothetical protein
MLDLPNMFISLVILDPGNKVGFFLKRDPDASKSLNQQSVPTHQEQQNSQHVMREPFPRHPWV